MKNIKHSYILYIVCMFLFPFFSLAQPGTLDIRFGEQGKIFENDYRAAADVIAVQKDDKIIAAGNFYSGVGLHVSRYNNDGSLDESFAEEGRFILRDLEGYGIGTTTNMLVQKDGKILIGARSILSAANQDISLIRLNTDGSLDNSFGGNGIVDLAIGPYDDEIGEMALQEDGKIIVAGLRDVGDWSNYDNEEPFILRLNTDGSHDARFGENGIVIQNFNGVYVRINALIVLPNGKMIMGGEDDGYYDTQVAMFKYNADGSLDTSFGNKGIVESRFPKDQYGRDIIAYIHDFLLLPSGKIFIVGMDNSYKMFLSKFTSAGFPDTSFGINKGYKTMNNFVSNRYGKQAHLVKGNKIIIAGSGFTAYRFLDNGDLDSSFGEYGIASNSFEVGASTGIRGSFIQPDGKILLAGSGANRNDDYSHICMLRLHGDGGITQAGYVKIKRWMKKNGISWWQGSYMNKSGSYNVQRSTDGINFTTVASVNKAGTTGENEYSYEDPSPAKGNNYYRLVYTNEAGKNMYSNIIAIEKAASLNIYPNPVTNYLNVAGINDKAKLYITDISGNIKMVANTANKNFHWNVGALNKGYYILKLETEGEEPVIKKFYKE